MQGLCSYFLHIVAILAINIPVFPENVRYTGGLLQKKRRAVY
jgi:hypothetical protein